MVTLTANVTEGIGRRTQDLVKESFYKSQSEVVRDALRQLALQYDKVPHPDIEKMRRKISAAGKKGGVTLTQTLREVRDED